MSSKPSRRHFFEGLLLTGLLLLARPLAAAENASSAVEFNRDVRPILSDKCYACHGPDEANRTSKLRFDTEAGAMLDLGAGRRAIVPGDAAKSELIQRITSEDAVRRMPPAYMGREKLTVREIDLLTRWVEQGAQWQKHWSFIPPKRRALPDVKNAAWPRNGLDHFVLERLEREGLQPSPEAERASLIRRLTLDLTGLPPTIAEIDAFLKDRSSNAYEKVVDRLLRSPRYGERMSIRWLDAARYADTNGYQTDADRDMWRWRDWVIEAFNKNMPFDQFALEQIAGDLLPNPTLEQRIATAFNRNHRGNGEGGIVAEEYAVEYVVDRLETTSTVFLGLTLGCARCHDHKYDPLSQKEFYQFFAYFNNIPERGKAFKFGNSPPMIPAPVVEQRAELAALEQRLAAAEKKFEKLRPQAAKAQKAWEQSADKAAGADWSVGRGLLARYALNGDLAGELHLPEGSETPSAAWREGESEFVQGPVGKAASFDGKRFIDAGDIAPFEFDSKFSLSAWIYPTAPDGPIVSRTTQTMDGESLGNKGYGVYLVGGKIQANIVNRWLDDCLRVETERPIELNGWRHVTMSYDGSRLAEGIKIYVDGQPEKIKIIVDEMNQSIRVKDPLRIGASGPDKRFQGYIGDVRVYDEPLTAEEATVIATAASLHKIAATPPAERTPAQARKLEWGFLNDHAPAEIREAWHNLRTLTEQREKLIESFPTVMVMQERATPPEAHLLIRGAYDQPGDRVEPGVPAVLPDLPQKAPNNRLGFAKWLTDPSNPLTARVTVNRFWQTFFGVGLVKTVEDFGSQGEWPAHPDLLDWLAAQFVESGWDVKKTVRTIVTSATYRQSSRASEELLQKDPENRLLARGPRFRLPAEAVRDQALAISGLLVEQLGGPSVKPYQPAGLWKEMQGESDYPQDHGEKLYRRSLYTYWKRSVPPPFMVTFDSAGREACSVVATRTNTPLQALNLMNDVTYVEAARKTAERMMLEGGGTPAERIGFGFRLATARHPNKGESEVLLNSFHRYLDEYQTNRDAALKLLAQGESPRSESLDVPELAAYTAVASLILNLDETVTKE
jgi:hypothetical protein